MKTPAAKWGCHAPLSGVLYSVPDARWLKPSSTVWRFEYPGETINSNVVSESSGAANAGINGMNKTAADGHSYARLAGMHNWIV
jgi:hypothetical protein